MSNLTRKIKSSVAKMLLPNEYRAFKAALSTRFTSDWITSIVKTNDDIKAHLGKLVERSRDLAKNNSDYKKWLAMRARNVTMGLTIQVKSKNSDGKLDTYANGLIEEGFRAWGKKRNRHATLDGLQSWDEACELFDRTRAIDGDCFVRIVKGADNPYLFTLEFLDSLDCDIDHNVDRMPNGHKIVMGIEIDTKNRPVAYYFKQDCDYYTLKKYTVISAEEIIHGYRILFPGQVRGIPEASAAILDVNMLDGYKNTALVGARVAAAQMGIWERSGSGGNLKLKGADSKKEALPDTEIHPGKILLGEKGWIFKPFTPTQPVANFGAFLKSIMRSIANGLGISYNDFANDLEGVNFSSLRGGTIAERDGWKLDQKFVIETFCEVVYMHWLQMYLLSGLTNLPFVKYDKFLADKWNGRRWTWVSPKDDAVAKEKELGMNVTSEQRICAEQGVDFDDIIAERAEAKKKLEKAGLTVFTNNKKDTKEKTEGDDAEKEEDAED